ncbi:unnamed protein product [Moneuplotes crassus]|uniref:Uncharacterized protein n=1 Tax=Euplotes crassus TaxID=5936 RepID=A0AAD1Y480_EUPCR|nr:unnamed protein product [Moneuplotes crassus]
MPDCFLAKNRLNKRVDKVFMIVKVCKTSRVKDFNKIFLKSSLTTRMLLCILRDLCMLFLTSSRLLSSSYAYYKQNLTKRLSNLWDVRKPKFRQII